jgi:hypothetical protein
MNRVICLFFCFVVVSILSEQSLTAQHIQGELKTVYGVIDSERIPLMNVNIRVEGTTRGTKTNANGEYAIQVRTGEVLDFTHVGFRSLFVRVEDVTEELNLEMYPALNELDTAVVTARKRSPVNSVGTVREEAVFDVDLPMPRGTFNPLKSGFSTGYIPGKLLQNGLSLGETLNGKVAGLRVINNQMFIRDLPVAAILVDGVPTPGVALPDSQFVYDVFVLRNSRTIYIRTIFNPQLEEARREARTEQYRNQNYYQDDAVAADSDLEYSSRSSRVRPVPKGPFRTISGKITSMDAPLSNVGVQVLDTERGTSTNRRGKFEIEARTGEVILFTHLGYKPFEIIVEDVTTELNFEMILEENELDEVVVFARTTDGKTMEYTKKTGSRFRSSMGDFDPSKAGYSVGYLDGDDLNPASYNLLDFLSGKVSGLNVNFTTGEVVIRGGTGSINAETPPLWEVDGMVLTQMPQMDPNDIKEVRVLKSISSLARYGTQGAGGVIVIQTRSGDFQPGKARDHIADRYANSNYYSNDARAISGNNLASENAQALVRQMDQTSNPELLKALAYQMEALGMKFEAVEAYKKVFKLRPRYAQSYRDLAHAYSRAEQFKQSWRMYLGYMNQGYTADQEGIGEIVYDEMEWLFYKRRNQTEIKQFFQTRGEDISDFQNDVRLVFEWNTSEAEFDLEFVAPDQRAYVFEHTMEVNQDLINEEKRQGFSSKRFFIEDIEYGDWLVNLTYKGNKKSAPTYFKLTTYYNWGKPNEYSEVRVYRLNPQDRDKLQLLKLNRQAMLAMN